MTVDIAPGIAQRFLGAVGGHGARQGVLRQHDGADGNVRAHRSSIAVDRLATHRLAKALGGDDQRMLVAVVEDGTELVTRKRAEHIPLPHAAQDPLADGVDHPIAGLVAEIGVDAADIEHGDNQEHRRAALHLEQFQLVVEALEQLLPIEPAIWPVKARRCRRLATTRQHAHGTVRTERRLAGRPKPAAAFLDAHAQRLATARHQIVDEPVVGTDAIGGKHRRWRRGKSQRCRLRPDQTMKRPSRERHLVSGKIQNLAGIRRPAQAIFGIVVLVGGDARRRHCRTDCAAGQPVSFRGNEIVIHLPPSSPFWNTYRNAPATGTRDFDPSLLIHPAKADPVEVFSSDRLAS